MSTHKVTFHLPTLGNQGLPLEAKAALLRLPVKGMEEDLRQRRVKVVYDADQVFLRQIYDVLQEAGISYRVVAVEKPSAGCSSC